MQTESRRVMDLIRNKPTTRIAFNKHLYIGQLRNFVLTFLAVNLASVVLIVMFGFVSPFLIIAIVILLALMNFFMFLASFTDPGLIPQNELEDTRFSHIPFRDRASRVNDPKQMITKIKATFPMGGFNLDCKYCPECNIFSPPRTSHCYICLHCVEKFDHHCPWIGVCVAKKNYFYFMMYIIFKTIYFLFVFAICLYGFIHEIVNREELNRGGTSTAIIVILAILGIAALAFGGFVFILTVFHIMIIFKGQTTKEYVKFFDQGHPTNPFRSTVTKTVKKFCTSRTKKSLLPHKVILNREVNSEKVIVAKKEFETAEFLTPQKSDKDLDFENMKQTTSD